MDTNPIFFDHSALDHINRRCRSLNFPDLFPACRKPKEDNNERFLCAYLNDQIERNEKGGMVGAFKECTCQECVEPHQQSMAVVARNRDTNSTAGESSTSALSQPSVCTPVQLRDGPRIEVRNLTIPNANGDIQIAPPTPIHYNHVHEATWHPSVFFPTWNNPWRHGKRCMPYAPFYCTQYADYNDRKARGEKVLGRPPHDGTCPVSAGYRYQS